MSRNDHLIGIICHERETKEKALAIYRLARSKAGPGSGRDIGPLSTGLPAVCSYLASQSLNNGDVKRADAQIASCLRKAEFEKVLTIVSGILDEADARPSISYKSLYKHYKPLVEYQLLEQYFRQIENQLVLLNRSGFKTDTPEVVGGIFHWVCVAAGCKTLPLSTTFSREMEIPYKKFVAITEQLNAKCTKLKVEIACGSTSRPASPTKAVTRTPSKRALRELPSRDTPRKASATPDVPVVLPQPFTINIPTPRKSPLKRALRELPSKDTPKKAKASADPFQSEPEENEGELPSVVVSPTKKPPAKRQLHELPSRDTPKKATSPTKATVDIEMASPAVAAADKEDDDMDVDELDLLSTPTKKRRVASPTKPTTRQSTSVVKTLFPTASSPHTTTTNDTNASPTRVTRSSTALQSPKKSAPASPRKSTAPPKKAAPASPQKAIPSTPRKQKAAAASSVSPQKRGARKVQMDVPMEDSESEEEEPRPRRFRPVYLDQRQWFSRDRRVARMWKQAEKLVREMEVLKV